MNKFSELSAESDMSALATVSFEETCAAEVPAPRVSRGINIGKLVRHNLSVPFAARISHAELVARAAFAPVRVSLAVLHAQISREVKAELDGMQASDAMLEAM